MSRFVKNQLNYENIILRDSIIKNIYESIKTTTLTAIKKKSKNYKLDIFIKKKYTLDSLTHNI